MRARTPAGTLQTVANHSTRTKPMRIKRNHNPVPTHPYNSGAATSDQPTGVPTDGRNGNTGAGTGTDLPPNSHPSSAKHQVHRLFHARHLTHTLDVLTHHTTPLLETSMTENPGKHPSAHNQTAGPPEGNPAATRLNTHTIPRSPQCQQPARSTDPQATMQRPPRDNPGEDVTPGRPTQYSLVSNPQLMARSVT